MEPTSNVLLVNLNAPKAPTPLSTAEIFNYFLIVLTVITGLIALIQVLFKIRRRIAQSPLFAYGIAKDIKC